MEDLAKLMDLADEVVHRAIAFGESCCAMERNRGHRLMKLQQLKRVIDGAEHLLLQIARERKAH